MKGPKCIVSDAYDRIAERYLEWRAGQPRQEEFVRWLSLLNNHVRPGVRILDMGCGTGIPLTLTLSNTFDVTGVDISARQIELAGRNVPLHVAFRTMSRRLTALRQASARSWRSLYHIVRLLSIMANRIRRELWPTRK